MFQKLTPKEKVISAKIQMMESHPFWAFILVRLNIIEDKDGKIIPEGAGGGVNAKGDLFYKPEWVDKLNKQEVITFFAHEVMHLVLLHLIRLNNRQAMIWNIATDSVINAILRKNNFNQIPGIIWPDNKDNLEIAGITIPEVSTLTADKVYELLMQVAKQDSKNGNGDGGLGGVKGFDYHGYEQLSETEKENISDQITSWTIGAAAYAKLRGHMPAGIDEIINKYLAPKLNWLQILKREMVELVKGEYSFNRPNRKFRHIILPGQVKADGIKAVVSMDTSGSMTTENLTRTFNELRHLKSVYRELEIIIIQHDCIVQKIEKITSRTKFDKLEARGRGGTAHLPVIEYIKKNLKGTKLYMAFTDGDSDIPESFPQLKCRKILFLNTSMYSVHKKDHFVKYARCYEVED